MMQGLEGEKTASILLRVSSAPGSSISLGSKLLSLPVDSVMSRSDGCVKGSLQSGRATILTRAHGPKSTILVFKEIRFCILRSTIHR